MATTGTPSARLASVRIGCGLFADLLEMQEAATAATAAAAEGGLTSPIMLGTYNHDWLPGHTAAATAPGAATHGQPLPSIPGMYNSDWPAGHPAAAAAAAGPAGMFGMYNSHQAASPVVQRVSAGEDQSG
jgi:hypothetical protein